MRGEFLLASEEVVGCPSTAFFLMLIHLSSCASIFLFERFSKHPIASRFCALRPWNPLPFISSTRPRSNCSLERPLQLPRSFMQGSYVPSPCRAPPSTLMVLIRHPRCPSQVQNQRGLPGENDEPWWFSDHMLNEHVRTDFVWPTGDSIRALTAVRCDGLVIAANTPAELVQTAKLVDECLAYPHLQDGQETDGGASESQRMDQRDHRGALGHQDERWEAATVSYGHVGHAQGSNSQSGFRAARWPGDEPRPR